MSVRDRMTGCTIVAANYLPYARVLHDGWARQHDAPLRVLVIDGAPPAGAEGLDIVVPEELGIDGRELGRLRTIYGPAELSTALKPHMLRFLLDQGADAALHVDADSDVRAPLSGVLELSERAGIALSPHFLAPPPLDGLSPGELEKAATGVFNSGVLGVGRSARPFLEWWAARVRRDCLFCDPLGTHADQRWLDFVPSYFDHGVIRDPGVNVAQWNLHERPVRGTGDGLTAAGVPLRTFHFAGFDPQRPDVLSSYGWAAPLRFDVAREPDLRRLCRDYADRVLAAGLPERRAEGYRYAHTAAGRPLDLAARATYRELLLAAEARGVDLPDAFDRRRSREFERMLDDPVRTGLLSPEAIGRVIDARVASPRRRGDLRDRVTLPAAFARQAVRRLPVRRHNWWPHPLPGDRTLREYEHGAGGAASRGGGGRG